MKIAFIHPDLGIGGAERLVVDAAVSLQEEDNEVTIYTSHCDRTHCFEEVANGTLHVEVCGDFFPTNIKGRLHIVFATLRQLWLCLWLVFSGEIERYDMFVLDQLPYCLPLLHYNKRSDAKTLFYCHFPDQLLASHASLVRSLYRKVFDTIEEFTTGCADEIVVNSKFTRSIFKKTFRSLAHITPQVIYPCVPTAVELEESSVKEVSTFLNGSDMFLSINRFERKKNISLAILAFADLLSSLPEQKRSVLKLVLAGGYDARVRENVEYLIELEELCAKLQLKSITLRGNLSTYPKDRNVFFLPSVTSDLKDSLISQCQILLYTPSFEHFGIVPLEAMRQGKIVLATDTGGPLETVENFSAESKSWTGFTISSDHIEWSAVMNQVLQMDPQTKADAGERAKKRVYVMFSRKSMQLRFLETFEIMRPKRFSYEPYLAQTVKIRFIFYALFAYYISQSLT
ncbi:unnamed protein product [Kuraishia capsulata CBS 1993]|uniref:Alpha-1,3/1,6-mannosyltransferase ALG2 n=1 Tax=Kuraishia capsulata CBS 1993 TaxID=1382522 RepID=W6MJA4_9ASCO|nr:uncharacterized protein KUCA_T00002004001 [Kuraishia capsulata CBS 1993]CDK26033.1 unnamed protein product [Kuraishia capsulata CBS 1993]